MKNFLDCFKEVMWLMMAFATLWGIGIIAFPQHAMGWSLIMLTVLGVAFFGGILLGAQAEQKRRWDMEELENASKIIDDDTGTISVETGMNYDMYDSKTLKRKFKKYKRKR